VRIDNGVEGTCHCKKNYDADKAAREEAKLAPLIQKRIARRARRLREKLARERQ
jgi:hypothetical protein